MDNNQDDLNFTLEQNLDYLFESFLMSIHYFNKAFYTKDYAEAKAVLDNFLFRQLEQLSTYLTVSPDQSTK